MHVTINGESHTLDEGMTVAELIRQRGTEPRRVAVEVNKELVRRVNFDQTRINEGDQIEIVSFVGGG
jgi:thiamine biosynthesis protein ThiS